MNRCLSSIYSNSFCLRILQFSTSCLPACCWLKFESTRVLAKFTAARFTGPEELELYYVPVSCSLEPSEKPHVQATNSPNFSSKL